jgi:hypothetical protein
MDFKNIHLIPPKLGSNTDIFPPNTLEDNRSNLKLFVTSVNPLGSMAVRVKYLALESDSHEPEKILLAIVKATVAAIALTVRT